MNDITVHSSDSKPSTAFCVALGGITSALVLLMMFSSTMFPAFDMAIPTFAGFLMVVIIIEAGTKWAVTAYFSCAALSLLMTPDYEAVLLFILFMGYYPILYVYIKKLKPNTPIMASNEINQLANGITSQTKFITVSSV